MMQSEIREVVEQHGGTLIRKKISIQPPCSTYKDYVFFEESCEIGAYSQYPKQIPYRLTRKDKRRIKFEESGNPEDLYDSSIDEHLALMGG